MKRKGKYSVSMLLCLLSVLTAAMLGGCGKAAPGETREEPGTATAKARDEADAAADSDGNGREAEAAQTAEDSREADAAQTAGIVFSAQDLEGNTVTEAVFAESKLTMVNVWATYCNPCLREMPDLGELAGEYDADEFQIIGIVSDVQEGADLEMTVYAATLAEQTGAAYPHLLLNESLFYSLLSDVSAVPTTFFVNEKGEVLDTVVGSLDKDSWKEKIDALLET